MISKAQPSLTGFFWQIIKPHQYYFYALLGTGIYWAVSNSVTPYVLKLIIDQVTQYQGEKSLLLHSLWPYLSFLTDFMDAHRH